MKTNSRFLFFSRPTSLFTLKLLNTLSPAQSKKPLKLQTLGKKSTRAAKQDRTKRDQTVPADLVKHLGETIPDFAKERIEFQWALASMLWRGGNKRKQHDHFDGAMSFGYQELDRIFGRRQFTAINDRLRFFKESNTWSMSEHWTKGYWLSDLLRESWEKYLRQKWQSLTQLLMANGASLKTLPAAVACKDMKGVTTTAWASAAQLNLVPVKLETLLRLRAWLNRIRDRLQAGFPPAGLSRYVELSVIDRLADFASKIIRLAKIDISGDGYIAQSYVAAHSGRLYAQGISLQTAPTLIKQAALVGLWEYDFSNCHFAILMQMAEACGYQCQAIAGYLADKDATRQSIAEQAGISMAQAKKCLLAMMYGARVSEWHENAIPQEIGQDRARRLYTVQQFNAIKEDIAKARTLILKSWKRTASGRLTNAYGKSASAADTPAQKMAHLIQGVEAMALKAAIDMYPKQIVLLQHDGFAATQKLDRNAITQAVYEATGYRLELEEKRIRVDIKTQFEKYRIHNEIGR